MEIVIGLVSFITLICFFGLCINSGKIIKHQVSTFLLLQRQNDLISQQNDLIRSQIDLTILSSKSQENNGI